jgi:hypothetical protein
MVAVVGFGTERQINGRSIIPGTPPLTLIINESGTLHKQNQEVLKVNLLWNRKKREDKSLSVSTYSARFLSSGGYPEYCIRIWVLPQFKHNPIPPPSQLHIYTFKK